MVAEAEVMFQQSLPAVLDVKLLRASTGVADIDGAVKSPVSSANLSIRLPAAASSLSADLSTSLSVCVSD